MTPDRLAQILATVDYHVNPANIVLRGTGRSVFADIYNDNEELIAKVHFKRWSGEVQIRKI